MVITCTQILRYSFGLIGVLLLAFAIADGVRPVGIAAPPRTETRTSSERDIRTEAVASELVASSEAPPFKRWYFAVSGDSRDCGDVIMPKIAASVATKAKQMPVKFYWHLGDYRALYRMDCDWAKR